MMISYNNFSLAQYTSCLENINLNLFFVIILHPFSKTLISRFFSLLKMFSTIKNSTTVTMQNWSVFFINQKGTKVMYLVEQYATKTNKILPPDHINQYPKFYNHCVLSLILKQYSTKKKIVLSLYID